MQEVIQNSDTYKRFVNCSIAIEILVSILLLALVIKQSINFYLKNYTPFLLLGKAEKKYE